MLCPVFDALLALPIPGTLSAFLAKNRLLKVIGRSLRQDEAMVDHDLEEVVDLADREAEAEVEGGLVLSTIFEVVCALYFKG
jgi:hypothetical protein